MEEILKENYIFPASNATKVKKLIRSLLNPLNTVRYQDKRKYEKIDPEVLNYENF